MDSKNKVLLIREGNKAFNEGNIRKAREIFLQTGYQDGLTRLGDHFMYDKKLPMLAYGYYKKAGRQDKVDEIFQRMVMALSEWLGKDKMKPIALPERPAKKNSEIDKRTFFVANEETPSKPVTPEDFRVHPLLKAKALEILNQKK